jgi:hypothetical protein
MLYPSIVEAIKFFKDYPLENIAVEVTGVGTVVFNVLFIKEFSPSNLDARS